MFAGCRLQSPANICGPAPSCDSNGCNEAGTAMAWQDAGPASPDAFFREQTTLTAWRRGARRETATVSPTAPAKDTVETTTLDAGSMPTPRCQATAACSCPSCFSKASMSTRCSVGCRQASYYDCSCVLGADGVDEGRQLDFFKDFVLLSKKKNAWRASRQAPG
jgi:hypothetical protein